MKNLIKVVCICAMFALLFAFASCAKKTETVNGDNKTTPAEINQSNAENNPSSAEESGESDNRGMTSIKVITVTKVGGEIVTNTQGKAETQVVVVTGAPKKQEQATSAGGKTPATKAPATNASGSTTHRGMILVDEPDTWYQGGDNKSTTKKPATTNPAVSPKTTEKQTNPVPATTKIPEKTTSSGIGGNNDEGFGPVYRLPNIGV